MCLSISKNAYIAAEFFAFVFLVKIDIESAKSTST